MREEQREIGRQVEKETVESEKPVENKTRKKTMLTRTGRSNDWLGMKRSFLRLDVVSTQNQKFQYPRWSCVNLTLISRSHGGERNRDWLRHIRRYRAVRCSKVSAIFPR